MIKKLSVLVLSVLCLVNFCGCVALVAGTAGGIGTAVWLSEKLTQEVNASFDKTVNASKSALESLKLQITKVTIEKDIAQIMGKYKDGKTIWIDIHRIASQRSKLEVRVGAVKPDKEAADKILKQITRYL